MESYIGPPALSLSKGATIHDVARSNWYKNDEGVTPWALMMVLMICPSSMPVVPHNGGRPGVNDFFVLTDEPSLSGNRVPGIVQGVEIGKGNEAMLRSGNEGLLIFGPHNLFLLSRLSVS
jgi:hypothetical protein